MARERTLSILKPDATERNLTGAINAKIEGAGEWTHDGLQTVEQIVGRANEQKIRRAGARFLNAPLQKRTVEDAGRRGGGGHASFRLIAVAAFYHNRLGACDEFVARGWSVQLLHKRNTQRKADAFTH